MLAVSAASLTAGLVSCGGSSDVATSGMSCRALAPGITPAAIKVGVILPDTGPAASSFRAFRAGVDARFDSVNEEEGGIYGRQITYAWRDNGGVSDLNEHAAQELVTDERVFGIVQEPSAAGGSIGWLNEQGVPVTGLALDSNWQGMNNMFSWYYFGKGSTTTWGQYLRGRGVSRVVVFATGVNATSVDSNQKIVASLRASRIQVVKTFWVAETTTSFQNLAQQTKAANVDGIAGVLVPEAAAQLLPDLRGVGLTLGGSLKAALLPLGYDSSVLEKEGPALAGVSIATLVNPFENDTPGQRKFRQAMTAYSPETQPPTQDSAVYGWLSADLFIRGLRAAGKCPTRESFITNLRAVKDYDGSGMTAPDRNDLSTNFREPSACYSVVEISPDGQHFVPQNDGQPYCGTAITPEQLKQLNQGP
ncbi:MULTISPECIES: ABC transporter substrate-binding protein [unclassified Pseudofrankia]|uniref:ABC transporter substrate-binding protein n=1 Tax=unclassified Pseudofrankia TaxID=2994372 RepID=UPI001F5250D2|nr:MULTISPECIES: ABC transporter substrate-binding protein [unclassified Pseudofrankia]MDT3446766.1 ABC transporter substrate-binding protein [Pseudofrankia sp. BMG5.37]